MPADLAARPVPVERLALPVTTGTETARGSVPQAVSVAKVVPVALAVAAVAGPVSASFASMRPTCPRA